MWVIYMHATPMHTETAVLERSQPNDGVGWESNRLLRSGPPKRSANHHCATKAILTLTRYRTKNGSRIQVSGTSTTAVMFVAIFRHRTAKLQGDRPA